LILTIFFSFFIKKTLIFIYLFIGFLIFFDFFFDFFFWNFFLEFFFEQKIVHQKSGRHVVKIHFYLEIRGLTPLCYGHV
jgi:hypothetical protein